MRTARYRTRWPVHRASWSCPASYSPGSLCGRRISTTSWRRRWLVEPGSWLLWTNLVLVWPIWRCNSWSRWGNLKKKDNCIETYFCGSERYLLCVLQYPHCSGSKRSRTILLDEVNDPSTNGVSNCVIQYRQEYEVGNHILNECIVRFYQP